VIRLLSISFLALSLSACATTKAPKTAVLEKVEVRAAELVEGDTFDVKETHERADQLYALGDFKQALSAYENTLVGADLDYENRPDAILGYADSALALATISAKYRIKAETAYKSLSEFPDLSDEHENRILSGQVLLEIAIGESEDAEVRLNEALEVNLHDPRLWNALGHFHDRAGEWVLATETYVKAIEAAREAKYPLAPIINNMGMSYLMSGRPKDALKKFEQAHDMNAEIEIYDNNRRLALVLTGRMDKAINDLTDKRAAQIYNDAGFLSARRGQVRKARSYYHKAIELSPTYFQKAEANLLALLDTEVKSGT
jgi:Flp pilus assembly protein TadD